MRPSDAPRAAIFDLAREAGFDLAGIAPFGPPPDAEAFDRWIDAGEHGSMDYLERGRLVTTDPRRQWPQGKSLLVVGLGHSRPPIELAGGGRIARYAAGRDYHNVVGKMLTKLRKRLISEGLCAPGSLFVDATPLMERSHAREAGLGFASKAANLLHPQFGPWFFLGEIILESDFEPTPHQVPAGSCGTCTACIDACPTAAITAPGQVDARRCISYATIEHRGLVEHELREQTGPWAFGCDVCSEVCPWGSKAPDLSERFGTRPEFEDTEARPGEGLAQMLDTAGDSDEQHGLRYQGSPLRRPRRVGIARNAAIALGNLGSDLGRNALLVALDADPSPEVRAAAAWALSRAHIEDAGVRMSLGRAQSGDPDESVRLDIEVSLERAGDAPPMS
ncbi:MAG: epoxyqueuosine reductase [Planctomycetota bacterium]|jgi:epoxyqueuosine reductase